MRKFLPLFLLLVFTQLASAQKKEEKKVRQTFESYKSAIMFDKGEQAAEYVDKHTIDYYSEMLNHTLYSDSAEIAALNLMDRLMVFSIRHRSPKETIVSLDGKGLLVYSINEGMVGKSSVANNTYNYILDPSKSYKNVDVSALNFGVYNLLLVCDGEITDVVQFTKQ